jgi:hypothetical protein
MVAVLTVVRAVDHKCRPECGSWRFVAVGEPPRATPKIRRYAVDSML